jgi:hypothetical protein
MVLLTGISGAVLTGIGEWYFTRQILTEVIIIGLLTGMLAGWPVAAWLQRGK